jgi:hypothetical protein
MDIRIGRVEQGIPFPVETGGRPRSVVRTVLDSLNVGESVFFGIMPDDDRKKKIEKIRGIANMAAKTTGVKFTTQTEDCGIRVWRKQ